METDTKSVLAGVLLVLLVTIVPAAGQTGAFAAVVAETGCGSKYSDEKKADLFAKYKDKEFTVTGQVSSVSDGVLRIKVLPATLTFDLRVKLIDPKVGYDLEKGERVTVRFIMRNHGGCFLSFGGDEGVINRGASDAHAPRPTPAPTSPDNRISVPDSIWGPNPLAKPAPGR
jgi:hypothetical protein